MLSGLWKDYQHAVVAIPDEKKGEQLVLFTTRPKTTFSEISTSFKAQGSSDLFVPRKIKVLEEMLLMGNGKTNYVSLTELAKKEYIN
jgi:acyl-[acyl-carrier-protein]-phospholipid O-acyltransferase/long-chain-fatty-acid--[acyl-carrier-protein] ligase